MKYAATSDKVIYPKKKTRQGVVSGGGHKVKSLTAIQRKIKASIENAKEAASQADIRKTRK
jgi:hypothetical protein